MARWSLGSPCGSSGKRKCSGTKENPENNIRMEVRVLVNLLRAAAKGATHIPRSSKKMLFGKEKEKVESIEKERTRAKAKVGTRKAGKERERERKTTEGEIICWKRGGRGHQSSICPIKPKKVNEVANPDQVPNAAEKRVHGSITGKS
eukprot:164229-Amphidinium_carterae.5